MIHIITCLSHRVSDSEIARAVGAGCGTFEGLLDELRVGAARGACVEYAKEAFHAQRAGACAAFAGGVRRHG